MTNRLVVHSSIANDDNLPWSKTLAGLTSDVTDAQSVASLILSGGAGFTRFMTPLVIVKKPEMNFF